MLWIDAAIVITYVLYYGLAPIAAHGLGYAWLWAMAQTGNTTM